MDPSNTDDIGINKLNKEELLLRQKVGIHFVDGENITAYKKIRCQYSHGMLWNFFRRWSQGEQSDWYFANKKKNVQPFETTAVATLEIPIGATVVLPKEVERLSDGRGDHLVEKISDKLRTDTLMVKKIEPLKKLPFYVDPNACECKSFHGFDYNYKRGKIHQSNLDTQIDVQCTTGLHFFLEKDKAENYFG